jgi:hypothetical protein
MSCRLYASRLGYPKDRLWCQSTLYIIANCGFDVAIIAGIFAVIANRLFGRRHGGS